MIASGIPEVPGAITVTIENLDVKFAWTTPTNNFNTITAYQILHLQTDGTTFSEESTSCNGSNSEIVSQTYCLVPESTLRAAPFSLAFDTMIKAKIRAYNVNGWSDYSSVNSAGALL